MTLEEIKRQAVAMRDSGETWTDIAIWIEKNHGLSVHRTTVQRWYDKEVYSDFDGVLIEKDTPDERFNLDKKVATHKAEAAYYKK